MSFCPTASVSNDQSRWSVLDRPLHVAVDRSSPARRRLIFVLDAGNRAVKVLTTAAAVSDDDRDDGSRLELVDVLPLCLDDPRRLGLDADRRLLAVGNDDGTVQLLSYSVREQWSTDSSHERRTEL